MNELDKIFEKYELRDKRRDGWRYYQFNERWVVTPSTDNSYRIWDVYKQDCWLINNATKHMNLEEVIEFLLSKAGKKRRVRRFIS